MQVSRPEVVSHKIKVNPISENRWNTILGEHKTTVCKFLPYTGVAAIFTNNHVRAISIIYSEIIGDKDHIWSGEFEVVA